jgi:hypothetical protein
MEHQLPDPYLPNSGIFFFARRMKLPLNFKSKVVFDPICSTISQNAREISVTSRPVIRETGNKGPFSKKFASWEKFKIIGQHAHMISIVVNVEFFIVFVFFVLTLLTFISKIKDLEVDADYYGSCSRRMRFALIVVLMLLFSGLSCIALHTYYGIFM